MTFEKQNYYVKDHRFQAVREVVQRDPFLWHNPIGIDTERIAGGQWTPSFITGEGDDCLRAAVSFQTTGGVWDHHKKCTYTAVNAYIAKGLAQNRVEAANMILELYGVREIVKATHAIVCERNRPIRYKIVQLDYCDGSVEFQEHEIRITYYKDGNVKSRRFVPTGREIVAPYPWNYPEFLTHEEMLYIVETEAEREVLTAFNFLTTSARDGDQGTLDWSQFVRNREVVLIPASGKAGSKFATRVADSLLRSDCKIRIVKLPNLRDSENITHWIERGGQQDALLQIVENTPICAGILFAYG